MSTRQPLRTLTVKKSDIGYNQSLFGGNMFSWVDECAYTFCCKLCNSRRMVTLHANCTFFSRIYEGDHLIVYGQELRRGQTSVTVEMTVVRECTSVFQCKMVFVKIDSYGKPTPILDILAKI